MAIKVGAKKTYFSRAFFHKSKTAKNFQTILGVSKKFFVIKLWQQQQHSQKKNVVKRTCCTHQNAHVHLLSANFTQVRRNFLRYVFTENKCSQWSDPKTWVIKANSENMSHNDWSKSMSHWDWSKKHDSSKLIRKTWVIKANSENMSHWDWSRKYD